MRKMLLLALILFFLAVLAGFAGPAGWARGLAVASRVCFVSFLIMLAAGWAAHWRRP